MLGPDVLVVLDLGLGTNRFRDDTKAAQPARRDRRASANLVRWLLRLTPRRARAASDAPGQPPSSDAFDRLEDVAVD
jgi:hypothetical protein